MENLFLNLLGHGVWWAYLLLLISAYVENIFPPIPGDTVTLIGAFFVGTGKLTFWGVWLSTSLGSILGFMSLFLVAYRLEWQGIDRFRPKWIKKAHLQKVDTWFGRYGYWIILANRFLSGIRSVISIGAGLSRLNILKVGFLAFLSGIIWNGLLIYAGAFVGRSWQDILHYIKIYNKVFLGILILVSIIYGIWRWRSRKAISDD